MTSWRAFRASLTKLRHSQRLLHHETPYIAVDTIPTARGKMSNRSWRPSHGITFANKTMSSTTAKLSADRSDSSAEYDLSEGEERAMLQHCLEAEDQLSVDLAALTVEDPTEKDWTVTYSIPDSVMQEALDAPPGSSESWWGYEKYVDSEGKPPTVHYCTSLARAEAVANLFLNEPVLGFDLEWEMTNNTATKTNIKRAVSVIQLSSESKIAVFHLSLFEGNTIEDLMPPTLLKILLDVDVLKAGVNVNGDMGRVNKCFEVNMKGLFELSHMYKQVKYGATQPNLVNRTNVRLAQQVEEYLGLPLQKGDERTSSWADRLPKNKTDYAASDAYAGYQLFRVLDELRKKIKPAPARPSTYEARLKIPLPDGSSSSDEEDSPDEAPEARPKRTRSPKADQDEEIPVRVQSPELDRASEWASNYRATLADSIRDKVGESDLRAYHLWHVQRHDLTMTASVMRSKPLAPGTVAGYVFRSVHYCKLPCESDRLELVAPHLGTYNQWLSKITTAQADAD